jgi:hypothetical protein
LSRLDSLLEKYKRTIGAPWRSNVSAPQRVIFVVYDPADELKFRARLPEFELATREAGHGWADMDLSRTPAEWIAAHEYREAYFEDPSALMHDEHGDVQGFASYLAAKVTAEATANSTVDSVFALYGLGALFGFARVAALVDESKKAVPGRYAVFFPGDMRDGNYRLLDARDGWNYLALAVLADET